MGGGLAFKKRPVRTFLGKNLTLQHYRGPSGAVSRKELMRREIQLHSFSPRRTFSITDLSISSVCFAPVFQIENVQISSVCDATTLKQKMWQIILFGQPGRITTKNWNKFTKYFSHHLDHPQVYEGASAQILFSSWLGEEGHLVRSRTPSPAPSSSLSCHFVFGS